MSSAAASSPPGAARSSLGTMALVAVAVVATAVAAVVGGPAAAVGPAALVGAAWAFWKAPLRWTMTALLGALLILEISSDTDGHWHTPLVALGDLLAENLDASLGIPGGKFNGLEVVLFALLAIIAWRRAHGARVDPAMGERTAKVVPDAVVLFLLGTAYAVVNGLANGGSLDVAIVQARPLVHIPLLYAVFHHAYSGRGDYRLLGRVIVFAALVRAGLAVWIALFVRPVLAPEMIYATNHGDSVLFSVACLVLLADLWERADLRRLAQALVLLPPIFAGMVANNRRLAWVMLAIGVLGAFVAAPSRRPWKQAMAVAGLAAAPLVALYIAAGWGSPSPVFAPVRILHTLSDGTVDSSTLYREIENWNLAMSIRESPLLGRGFGHTYTEHARGADISSIFALYNAVPHNGVLGLLLFAGLLAFLGIWSVWAVGVYLAVRIAHTAQDPGDRVAALASLGALLSTSLLVYGDLGFAFVQTQLLLALSLSVVGKLAVATGAWPLRVAARSRAAESAQRPLRCAR